MTLKYVYTTQGQFKENNQIKIDYTITHESKLFDVVSNEKKIVENFSNNIKKFPSQPCVNNNECISNICLPLNSKQNEKVCQAINFSHTINLGQEDSVQIVYASTFIPFDSSF